MFRALNDNVLLVSSSQRLVSLLEEKVISGTPWKLRVADTGSMDIVSTLKEADPDLALFYIDEDPGLTIMLVSRIMFIWPVPSIILTSDPETMKGMIMKCLDMGAVDVLTVPADMDSLSRNHVKRIQMTMESARLVKLRKISAAEVIGSLGERAREQRPAPGGASMAAPKYDAVGVAVSTGGPQALGHFIPELPADFPAPVLVVQHIIKGFIGAVAQRLDRISAVKVKVAEDNEKLMPGTVYFAPDRMHMRVRSFSEGGAARVFLSEEPEDSLFRPSADELFNSMAEFYGARCVAVIMTGMGRDGVGGLAPLKEAGALTIAQDEHSSVIYGMANVAVEKNLIDVVSPLGELARRVVDSVYGGAPAGDAQSSYDIGKS